MRAYMRPSRIGRPERAPGSPGEDSPGTGTTPNPRAATIVDPIHRLVTLERRHIEIAKLMELELDRLKRINHLGWVAGVFPGARHSKWEHSIGTYHVAKIAFQRLRLPGVNRDHLLGAALVHSLGHCPYTSATEEGILLAVASSNSVAEGLRQLLNPIQASLGGKIPGIGDPSSVPKGRERLSRLLTLLLLERKLASRESGRWLEDVARYLFDADNLGYQVLRTVDELDYVVRDLYHSGTATLTLNYESMLEGARIEGREGAASLEVEHLPEWSIIESFRGLLIEKVLADERVLATEGLFSRIVAKAIIEGKVYLSNLLEWDDSELWTRLQKDNPSAGESIKRALNGSFKTFFSTPTGLGTDSPVAAESTLVTGISDDIIEYPFREGFLLSLKPWNGGVPDCYLLVSDDARKLRPILALGDKIAKLGVKWNPWVEQRFEKCLARLLFGRFPRVETRGRALDMLEDHIAANLNAWTKLFAEKFDASRSISEDVLFVPPTELSQDIPENAPFALKYAATKTADPHAAAADLIRLISRRPECFHSEVYGALAKSVQERFDKQPDPRLIESRTFLQELEEAASHESKWVIPNVECYDNSGRLVREVDVVVVWLTTGVNVRLVECTSQDREHKSAQDAAKIVEVKSELEQRFDDLAVKTRVYGKNPQVEFKADSIPSQQSGGNHQLGGSQPPLTGDSR